MTLDDIDTTGLIRESYRIDGVTTAECRSIFLDWAIRLPADRDDKEAIRLLLDTYAAANPAHPMTQVLNDGLLATAPKARKGGRAARLREIS